jgi:putative phosphoesterase
MRKEMIAIISDIHANVYALNAFLDYIDRNYNVAKILNLGDFVQIGPHPREVAKIVLNDNRFINILGNNESRLLNRNTPAFSEEIYFHQDWTIEQLGQPLMDQIRRLPMSRVIGCNNKNVLMVHSRLSDNDAEPLLYQGKTLDEFTNDYGDDIDYILFGHTHCQTYVNYWKGKPLLNPGSLGCSKESIMSFCLLDMDDGAFNINLMNISYDNSRLKEDYLNLNVPKMVLIKKFMGIEY